jgi:hypothetical protein
MAGGRNLTVYLTSDVTKFTRGLGKAESNLKKFGKRVGIGVAAAGAMAVAIGVDAVQAAMKQEKANKRLGKTLDNLGLGEQTDAVLDNVAAMQSQYGVSEDDLIPAFEKLVGVTGDTDEAFGLLNAAMDTAAGTGKPLETITSAIAKAMDGNAGALKRVIPGLDTTAISAGNAASAMKVLNARFGGQAQANAETTAGTMERISLAGSEISESLGTGILDGFVGGDADAAVENLEQAAENAERVGRALGTLGTNAMGWASDFILGLEAIGYYSDSWAIRVTKNINGVLDLMGVISDEEGQRRLDAANGMQTRLDFNTASTVNGNNISGTGGGNFGDRTASDWGSFYGNGSPRSVDPNRYKNRAGDSDARAAARGTKTRANP